MSDKPEATTASRRRRWGKNARAGAAAAADSPAVVRAPGAGPETASISIEAAEKAMEQQKTRKRRVELLLMLFSIVIIGAAMTMVQYTTLNTLSWDILKYTLAFLIVVMSINIAMRFFAPNADPYLMPLVTLLNGLGLVLINRLDLVNKDAAATGAMSEGNRQILWTFIAVAIFILTLWLIRDHRVLSRYSYTLGLVGVLLLAIPAVLPSQWSEVNGSKIWIRTPFFSIQPGEFSKILIIISIAAILVSKRELFATTGKQIFGIELPRARDLAPILLLWVIAVVILVVEKDLGTSLLIFATVLTMIYVATNRVSWLLIGLIGFIAAALLAFLIFGHVKVRVFTWLNPLKYFDTNGYQLSQAMFGLGTGGVAGSGLGHGRPDLVPYASTDFIISTVGEELGLIGLAGILILYGIMVQRMFRTSLTVRDSFGKLMVTGLSFTMAFQVFVVVGGVTRVIPLTGLTTPFLSYGGSSLLANYLLMALVLRVSDQASRIVPRAAIKGGAATAEVVSAPRASRIRLRKKDQQKAEETPQEQYPIEDTSGDTAPAAPAEPMMIFEPVETLPRVDSQENSEAAPAADAETPAADLSTVEAYSQMDQPGMEDSDIIQLVDEPVWIPAVPAPQPETPEETPDDSHEPETDDTTDDVEEDRNE